MKDLIESGEPISTILRSFVESENTSFSWEYLDDNHKVSWKQLKYSQGTQDVINSYDLRKLQGLSLKRIEINQISFLSLKNNYRLFKSRKGLTIVLIPYATNLCIEFNHQGSKQNHCFKNTRSFAIAIGDDTEFKLLGKDLGNDFATVIFC